jgi:hypothetical protein
MYRLLRKRNQRRLGRYASGLRGGVAGRAIAPLLPPLHDLDYQTVVLRSGIALGAISPLNVATSSATNELRHE